MLVIREASFQISREIALQGEVAHNATHPGAAKPSVLFANLCYVGRAGAGVCIPHCRGLPLVVRPRLRLAPGFRVILLVFTCQYDAVVFLGPSLLVGPLGVAIGACFHAFSPGVTETRRCLEWDFQILGEVMAYSRCPGRHRGVAQGHPFGRHHVVEAVGVSEGSSPGLLCLFGALGVRGAHRLSALGAIQHELSCV